MYRAIIACLLWGSAFAGAKIGFEYTNPLHLSGMRFTLAGMLLFPILWRQHVNLKELFKHWRFLSLFAFLQTFMQYGLFFMGLNLVPAATAAIIIGAGPLFVAIMAHFFMPGDRMTMRKVIAIGLGLLGVVSISIKKGDVLGSSSDFYLGIALLLASNLVGGYTNIMVAKYKAKLSPVALTSYANFFGGLLLYVVSLVVTHPEFKIYPIEFYGALIWLAIIPAAAFSLWYGLLQRPGVKVSDLNVWKFIVPVTGCVLSWLIVPGEHPDANSITGIVIISMALIILQLPQQLTQKLKRSVQKLKLAVSKFK